MSNEMKDWLEDMANAPVKSKEWNRWLLHAYPWMTPANAFSGKRISDCAGLDGDEGFWPGTPTAHPEYDYEYTLADDFPDGWWSNFGLEMCKEIDQCLRKLPQKDYDDFRVVQIKEKFGTLRFYTNWETKEIGGIINKYEQRSAEICQKCGKPATHMSLGWISYFCADCAPKGSVTLEEVRAEEAEDNDDSDGWTMVSIEPRNRI